jgi:peptide subunit release factor 1 (eRF1)
MAKLTLGTATPLRAQLDRLAAFDPTSSPVLSLYLDMRPDQNGRRNHDVFLRKVFSERSRSLHGDARRSFDRDVDRITRYLAAEVSPSMHGLALFACSASDNFWEACQLAVPFEQHSLFIGAVPHLYPLARLGDQFPAYAALLVDTNSARLFVFRLGRREAHEEVKNVKTRRSDVGGWSQARYQRHAENFHLHHMKEVVAVLDRVVRAEAIDQVIVAAEETARSVLFEQLPKHLTQKVVDVLNLSMATPEHTVLAETLDALRQRDAATDVERVRTMIDGWAAGGLGVVGPEATLDALMNGQVEELLITARPDALRRTSRLLPDSPPGPLEMDTTAGQAAVDTERIRLAGELVARAQQNAARVRFVEDPALLDEVGGVGAILRFRI